MVQRETRREVHNFRKMRIYGEALQLVTEVYELTRKLPHDEAFGLTSQLRRAAVSVVLNIAEGSGASTNQEFLRFLDIARRSIYEINACLAICTRINVLAPVDCRAIVSNADALAAMISRFRSRLAAG